ncbi:MAG: hypothetical protein F4098_04850 [Acidimicrobiaceae bacterium]|nr:hypothetical protein [Acidimicrobiaceae bacterium]MYD06848.1 hypothetical protein [Acidimicrobiaceae bacterium]MYI57981.1 hypothetical protein [Acidimicrobiaceae bacterium]
METGTDPAVLALISTLFVVMIGNFWHQSRENTKTRDLIVSTNAETRTELHREIKELGDHLHGEIKELRGETKALGDRLRGETKALGDHLHGEIKELGDHLHGEIKELGDHLHGETKEVDKHVRSLSTEVAKLGVKFTEFKIATEQHQRTTEQNHKELRDGLSDNRERLARIEGHLGIAPAPAE